MLFKDFWLFAVPQHMQMTSILKMFYAFCHIITYLFLRFVWCLHEMLFLFLNMGI
jgi:hypothetical protein